MSNIQYVRAGACTQGKAKNTRLVQCALEVDDCPSETTFWPASELAKALGVEAAICLQAEATNRALNAECNNGSTSASATTGSCLVEEFNAQDAYYCAVSQGGCASGDIYLSASETVADAYTTCRLCGLTSSMDYDLSTGTGGNFISNIVGDDSTKQLEAVGIVGIVAGVLLGFGILLCLQRLCCRGKKKVEDPVADEKSSDTQEADISETKDVSGNGEEEQEQSPIKTPGIV